MLVATIVRISALVKCFGVDFCMIGMRIKEERERLALTQPVFAEAAGAKKRTLIDWEKGVSSPTAVQLSALARLGVDVMYVLTGQRSQESVLSQREAALLDNYRHSSQDGQDAIERVALVAAKPNQEQLSVNERSKNTA